MIRFLRDFVVLWPVSFGFVGVIVFGIHWNHTNDIRQAWSAMTEVMVPTGDLWWGPLFIAAFGAFALISLSRGDATKH